MEEIKLKFNFDDYRCEHPDVITTIFLMKMRKVGIPVKGILLFRGVERGKLFYWKDFETNDIHIVWRDQ